MMSSGINPYKAVRALALAAVMAGLGATTMLAQDTAPPAAGTPPPPPHHRMGGPGGDRMIDHMQKTLNLTPDQVTQIKGIQADTRSQMMALHKGEQDKVRATLTDEQKTKFDQMQARMKERRGRGPRGNGAPPPPPPDASGTQTPR